jgi:hypothetical protein
MEPTDVLARLHAYLAHARRPPADCAACDLLPIVVALMEEAVREASTRR